MEDMQLKVNWKVLTGYNGRYLVSDTGEVVQLDRMVIVDGQPREVYAFLKQNTDRRGYRTVSLTEVRGGKQTYHKVHRLVGQMFIPNPDGKPYINHIDENAGNNHVSNLEWVTQSENTMHGTGRKRRNETYRLNKAKRQRGHSMSHSRMLK